MAPRAKDANSTLRYRGPNESSENLALDLKDQDKWMATLNLDAFREDIKGLGKRLSAEQGPDDVAHLNKIIMWSNLFTLSGVLSMGWIPASYIFSAVLLSIGLTSRWVMIAHHTCHGGYDNCEKSGRFNRFKFALGSLWRRFIDWFDWMHPEAWNVEHNNLHHYHLSEIGDPDLLERNMMSVRESNMPLIFKYAIVGVFFLTWKWSYYAPNTYKELRIKEVRKSDPKLLAEYMKDPKYDLAAPYLFWKFFDGTSLPPFLSGWELITRVMGPFFIYRFFILPLPWLLIGFCVTPETPTGMYWNSIINLLIADVLSNIHTFIIIAPNHAGYDMYKFETHCKPRSGMFYLRQVISSANFAAGTDYIDFPHGFLNYQIEHHLWPDLSMLSYQRAMPLVKGICKTHNVPYIQESVFTRVKKTVDIMVGNTHMKPFPEGVLSETY